MIDIIDKTLCCGCWACSNVCPKSCIDMREDQEGFLYPKVRKDDCVDCHLCEKVCPVLNTKEKRSPKKIFAAKNKDKKVVEKSSSGGVFFHFAKQFILEGGVVFGARFDKDWNVVHDYTDNLDGISQFMTSKYVQSQIGNTYSLVKDFLKSGRKVLFTGTPCQIGGLHNFLRKRYSNLFTMDFLCHGVPSPKVWKMYLHQEANEYVTSAQRAVGRNTILHSLQSMSLIEDINFREKSEGWQKSRFVLRFAEPSCEGKRNSVLSSSSYNDNVYMKGFLNDLYLRPSCYKCKFKRFQSQSDITIADYWAIARVRKEFYDRNGVSMVFINDEHALAYLTPTVFDTIETSFEDTLSNKGLHEFVEVNKYRANFFAKLDKTNDIKALIAKYVEPSFIEKIIKKIKWLVKR